MTEAEWAACNLPRRMLKHLLREAAGEVWQFPQGAGRYGSTVPRRWRLVVAAFLRRLPPRRGPYLETAERLERLADAAPGAVDWAGEWRAHHRHGWERYRDFWMCGALRPDFAVPGAGSVRVAVCRSGAAGFRGAEREAARRRLLVAEEVAQSDLTRCIFGNPFRPVALDPTWLTPAAVGLAVTIYVERAWDRLPILADALEDAGCTNPDVLAHLRGPAPHARGCWVVDLVLGKA